MTAAISSAPLRPSARWSWFGVFAFGCLIGSQALGFATSPPDQDMGDLQKIMYVHVPAAWNTFMAFFVVLVCSLRYLFQAREQDDLLAAASAEVGATFNGLTLALGMIWGRPTWNAWWVWDPRLTSTLVLFLIFVGYLSLREFVEDTHRRAQWSAAVGILGAINVPIVYMSVKWWRTIHQLPSSPSTVDPAYVLGLRTNAFAFLFVMIYFIRRRYEVLRLVRATEVRGSGRRTPRELTVGNDIDNWRFIAAAYTVTWVVLLGYLGLVHRALARARADHDHTATPRGRP